MKLLILTQKVDTTDDNLGFFHRWIEEFAKKCESVVVVCLYEGVHTLPANVRVRSLGKEKGVSRVKYLFRFFSYIWRERKNYDFVFVHMNQMYVVLGGLLWRLLGKRIGLWYAHGRVNLMLRLAMYFVHDAFTSTPQSLRIESPRRHVIGHGIDTELFALREQEPSTDIVHAISVGRISPVKEYETIIEAEEILRKKGIAYTIEIVGTPGTVEQRQYLGRLQLQVKDVGADHTVQFVGPSLYKELPKRLARAHIFVSASQTGSLDKAPLEAMATGLPVLVCNESVIEELPEDIRDMLSFTPHDAVELADKMITLAHLSREERERIGRALRNIVIERHALPHLIEVILTHLSA